MNVIASLRQILRLHTAIAVPAIYVVVSAAYIVTSDLLVHPPSAEAGELKVDLAKGLAFVLVTGFLLHLLLRFAFVPAAEHRATLASYARLVDVLPNVFLETDAAGRVTGWNDNALRLTGASADSLRNSSATALLAEDDRAAFDATLAQVERTRHPRTFDARLLTAGGAAIPFAWHAMPQHSEASHNEVEGNGQESGGRGDDGGVAGKDGFRLIGIDVSPAASIRSALANAVDDGQGKGYELMRQSIEAIAHTLELRDPYTSGHQSRVADLSVAIGRRPGLPPDRLEGLRYAALLHDLGKIAVPSELLVRPDRLEPLEMEMIRHHVRRGHEVLAHVDFPWPVADVALHHHERLDGSGYPDGLVGDAISLDARIVAVADVVEAMTSHRPYRPALGLEPALEEIRIGAGRLYDPDVVAACCACFESGFTFATSHGAAAIAIR